LYAGKTAGSEEVISSLKWAYNFHKCENSEISASDIPKIYTDYTELKGIDEMVFDYDEEKREFTVTQKPRNEGMFRYHFCDIG